MRRQLTEKQSWVIATVILAIVILATILLGFIINAPMSFGGLVSLGGFTFFIILLIVSFFYYRKKHSS